MMNPSPICTCLLAGTLGYFQACPLHHRRHEHSHEESHVQLAWNVRDQHVQMTTAAAPVPGVRIWSGSSNEAAESGGYAILLSGARPAVGCTSAG